MDYYKFMSSILFFILLLNLQAIPVRDLCEKDNQNFRGSARRGRVELESGSRCRQGRLLGGISGNYVFIRRKLCIYSFKLM